MSCGETMVNMSLIFIILLSIWTIISLSIGVPSIISEHNQIVAGKGLNGTCEVVTVGKLLSSCLVCPPVFSLVYFPILNSNIVQSQDIPYNASGLKPDDFASGQIVQCYSQDFNNQMIVVWRRLDYDLNTQTLVTVGCVCLTIIVILTLILLTPFLLYRLRQCCDRYTYQQI